MKNMVRVFGFVWPYRGRLILSIVCAFMVAAIWGAIISSIYPLQILLGASTSGGLQVQEHAGGGRNMQQWVNEEIAALKKKAQNLDERIKDYHAKAEAWPADRPRKVRAQAGLNRDLADLQDELAGINTRLSWYQFTKYYIDKYCPEDRFQTIVALLLLVAIGFLLKGVLEFWHETLVGSIVHLSLFDLLNALYRRVIHLDVKQFNQEGTHALMARFTNDIPSLGKSIQLLFGKVIAEPLKAISCILFACFISWRLTLLFIVVVPAALLIMNKVGTYVKRASRRMLESVTGIFKILQESFQGIKVVKAFTTERCERRRFFIGTKDYYYKCMKVVRVDALSGPLLELMALCAVAISLLAGAYLVLRGKTHLNLWLFEIRMTEDVLDTASLLTLYGLLAAVAEPVRKLSSVYTKIQAGGAAAERIFAYMDKEPGIKSNVHGPRLARHARSVEFREVCFSYHPGRPVLHNVSLDVRFGETIALIGKNGCGKTTLVGLLPRFLDPDHGAVFIDGVDVREVNLRSLRQQIGLVSQETVLFDDTIYNNIAYGRRHAPQEDVEAAAKQAYAHDFILKMPNGYQSRVGEMGASLSGGQRQRIALARAILRDPSILILDEATSATDLESEELILRALKDFAVNRTTFLITHRLAMLENADRIVVIDNGRIEAVGTHKEMMNTSPLYQRLHEVHALRPCA